jgi:hypothetical protein
VPHGYLYEHQRVSSSHTALCAQALVGARTKAYTTPIDQLATFLDVQTGHLTKSLEAMQVIEHR